MTTMDVAPPALLRLFSRLDFGPSPAQGVLAQGVLTPLLKQWTAACGDMPFPRASDLAKQAAVSPSAFVFQRLDGERDYALASGLAAAEAFLGPLGADGRLSRAENRRNAVRLRRLFEESVRTGAPFVAQFILKKHGRDAAAVDALIAPLSEDGQRIDSFLGALSIQAFQDAALAAKKATPLDHDLALFGLGPDRELAQRVANLLHLELAPHEERRFEDGEF